MVVVSLVLIVDCWNCFGYCWVWVKLLIGGLWLEWSRWLSWWLWFIWVWLFLIWSGWSILVIVVDCESVVGGCFGGLVIVGRGGGSWGWSLHWCGFDCGVSPLRLNFVWVRVDRGCFGGLMRCGIWWWMICDWFVYVSKWWVNRVNVTFSLLIVSLWNDDGSRMLNWSLWWVN